MNELPDASTAAWEEAYARFETPEQEIRKFVQRLKRIGCESWASDVRILELFCGRGNGLHALESLGFSNLAGADLSARLAALYEGSAEITVCDCRSLTHFADSSRDVVIVQGGLHHLLELPTDLEATLDEARRVLAPDGRLVVVEPWLTPFLRFVHATSRQPLVRKLWPKIDAFATMVEHEWDTYEQWLEQPDLVLECLETRFHPLTKRIGWGKLTLVGRPHAAR